MFNIIDIPAWSQVNNACHYQSQNSDRMIITVGDSWTYGDSLGNTRVRDGIDDTDYRLAHVYGNLISQDLGADWINLALPGISNQRMFTWLEQLLSRRLHYANTTCIITLTESGRHEELNWLKQDLGSLQTNLERMLDNSYKWIGEIQKRYPSIKFVVTHSFTDSRPSKLNVCQQTWLEVLTNSAIQNNTHVVVSEHIKQLNYNHTYTDTPDVIDRALERINLLDSCTYCYKHDSRHPNEQGHKLWAQYLLTQI
jgi:hypothetical protein